MIDFLTQAYAITTTHPFIAVFLVVLLALAFTHVRNVGHAAGYREGVQQRAMIVVETAEQLDD